MYRIEETEQAIAAIQRYLVIISQIDNEIPHIAVDGVYNVETREAVSIFQSLRGIQNTGIVDYFTFKLLLEEATIITDSKNNSLNVFSEKDFPLKIGDSGNDVNNLNTLLREFANDYTDITDLPYGSFFSRETLTSVLAVQKRFLLELNSSNYQ